MVKQLIPAGIGTYLERERVAGLWSNAPSLNLPAVRQGYGA